jgi:hypothetical protein
MRTAQPALQEFKNWKGDLFWRDCFESGRVAHITYLDQGETFIAVGYHEPSSQLMFAVRGSTRDDFPRFATQMLREGADVDASPSPFSVLDGLEDPRRRSAPPGMVI